MDGGRKVSTGGGVGNGDAGYSRTASRSPAGGSGGSGNGANGSSSNSNNNNNSHAKKRRVIDDDDDDDAPAPPPRQRPAGGAATTSSGSKYGGGGVGSGANGTSSSMSSARGGGGGGGAGGQQQQPEKKKKIIVPGPSSSSGGGGGGGGSGKSAGSKSENSSSSSSKAGTGDRKKNASNSRYDDDDDDMPLGSMIKKHAKTGAAPSSSSSGGRYGNLTTKGPRTFTIPKREGLSSGPGSPSSSSSARPSGSGGGGGGNGSSYKKMGGRPGGGGNNSDADFERKPNVKVLKRPADFRRADDDPAKLARRKRKLEEERQRLQDEARRKKRREGGSGASASSKSKVKAEPGRRGSSAGGSGGKARPRGDTKARKAAPPREPVEKRFKETTRAEKIEQAMKVYKWWEEEAHEPGKMWDSMEHNGAHFAPAYEPHGVKLKYDGNDVHLTPLQEEVATFYASMPLDGPQLAEQGTVFNKNFFADFKKVLGKGHKIKDFKLLDFSAMRSHLETAKQIKRAATDGEKAAAKTVKEELTHKYSYAIVDGHLEKVGNYNVEPPGLFRGRGKHPKTGMLKARVMPSDIALNCAESVCVPRCNVPGYGWQTVQHDPSVTWLSKWDGLLAGTKYMMLAASSSFKGKSDMAKYDKAMKLKGFIGRIREDYTKKLSSGDKRTKQIATAVWIIDKLALRVGGEKGDDEADTVGCCSLRTEHLTFHEDNSVHEIDLEFLGKDSMLFKETIDFDRYGEIGTRVFKNLQTFCKGKRQSEEVFDYLEPSILNQHLQSLMPGLTAKVFRTYNASETLQRQLPQEETLTNLSVAEKVALYNGANREVAILCNHQKTVSSAQKEGLEKLHDRLAMLNKQKHELKVMLKTVKTGKGKVRLKSNDKSAEDGAQRALEKAKKAKANAETDAEKVAATKAAEAAATLKKAAAKAKAEEMHLFAKNPSEESLVGRIKGWTEKIKKLQIDIRDRDDNKEVSLGTSKINYMDPRISVAWCKRHEVPVEKVFAKTLRDKFVWSMNIPPDWEFSYETLLNSKQSVVGGPASAGKAKKKAPTPAKAPKKPAAAAAAAAASPKAATAAKSPASAAAKGKTKAAAKKEESSEEEEDDDDDDDNEEDSSSSGDDDDDDDDDDNDEEDSSSSGEEGSSSSSGEEEDDDDEEEEEEEAPPPSKKRRSEDGGGGGGESAPKKARRPTIEDDDDDEEEEASDGGDGDSDFAP